MFMEIYSLKMVKNISFTKIQEICGIKKYFNYPVGSGNIFKKYGKM